MKTALALHDIRFDMHVGHLPEERNIPQTMRFDIDVKFNEPPLACETDELDDSVCYDALIADIKHYCEAHSFALLEHLAMRIYCLVKSKLPKDASVNVRVTKCNPPIDALKGGAACEYGD